MHGKNEPHSIIPLRILVVEADPAAAELLKRARLKGAPNVELERVRNGPEALEYLRRQAPYEESTRPHVVVTSISSDEEEREFIRDLKRDDALESIPVVVLTLRTSQDGDLDGARVGGSLLVAKPMNFPDLVALFRELDNFFGDIVTLPGKPGRRW